MIEGEDLNFKGSYRIHLPSVQLSRLSNSQKFFGTVIVYKKKKERNYFPGVGTVIDIYRVFHHKVTHCSPFKCKKKKLI